MFILFDKVRPFHTQNAAFAALHQSVVMDKGGYVQLIISSGPLLYPNKFPFSFCTTSSALHSSANRIVQPSIPRASPEVNLIILLLSLHHPFDVLDRVSSDFDNTAKS